MVEVNHHSSRSLSLYNQCSLRGLKGWLVAAFFVLTLANNMVQSAESLSLEPPVTQDAKLEKLYQQVLFAYYQDDLDAALLQYSLLEWYYPQGLQQLPEHLYLAANEPELLKGSISLAYGLEDQAADIFKRLLATYDSPEKRTKAWFALGQTYYQQGQGLKASQAFSHINRQDAQEYLSIENHDRLLYLVAQLYHQHGLGEQGGDWQQQLSDDSIYHYYLQYNQALASLHAGDTQQGIRLLERLAGEPEEGLPQIFSSLFVPLFIETSISTEEQYEAQQQEILAIQDRVNLTLAYTLLQQGESHAAYEAFARIRREGLDGDAALLGYGWAAAKGNELQIALGIWQSLMALPQHSEYSLEAHLASAYAFEKGFAPRQAVATLQQGVQRFKQVLNELAVADQQIKQAPFIQALAHNYVAEHPSLELTNNSEDLVSNNPLLSQLVVTAGMEKSFRNQLSALQQTQNLATQLREWQQRMGHYSLMLDERQTQRVNRAQAMLQARVFDKLSTLQQRREQLAELLLSAQQQQDGSSLMSVDYQQSLTRLTRAQGSLVEINQQKELLQQSPLKAEYAERLRRLQGILSWQADEEFAANSWQAQKALAQLDLAISQTAERQSRLIDLLAARPDYAEQRQRVAQLAKRIDGLLLNNQHLQSKLVAQLSAYLENNIEQFKSKVNDYVVQAQLALVRLNDQALQQNQNDKDLQPADIGRPPQLDPARGQQP